MSRAPYTPYCKLQRVKILVGILHGSRKFEYEESTQNDYIKERYARLSMCKLLIMSTLYLQSIASCLFLVLIDSYGLSAIQD